MLHMLFPMLFCDILIPLKTATNLHKYFPNAANCEWCPCGIHPALLLEFAVLSRDISVPSPPRTDDYIQWLSYSVYLHKRGFLHCIPASILPLSDYILQFSVTSPVDRIIHQFFDCLMHILCYHIHLHPIIVVKSFYIKI